MTSHQNSIIGRRKCIKATLENLKENILKAGLYLWAMFPKLDNKICSNR